MSTTPTGRFCGVPSFRKVKKNTYSSVIMPTVAIRYTGLRKILCISLTTTSLKYLIIAERVFCYLFTISTVMPGRRPGISSTGRAFTSKVLASNLLMFFVCRQVA